MGSRLGAITARTPKPVLEIGDRPFLYWLMREMLRFGVEEFVLLTGHLSDAVEGAVRRAAEALPKPVTVRFSVEPEPAGTGGALWHGRRLLADRARQHYTAADLASLMAWVGDEARRAGGTIDDWRHCPHRAEDGCDCRKPQPGMLRALIAAWELDPSACLMVGDQPTDLLAAQAAGVPGLLFPGGDLHRFLAPHLKPAGA